MTAALILAADEALSENERSPIEPINGASSLIRLITIYRIAGIERIVIVTGYNEKKTKAHCSGMGAIFVHNDNYRDGSMLGSVKIGVGYLKDKCDKAFISPAYMPLFSSDTVKRIAYINSPVVIPMYHLRTGRPILLQRVYHIFWGKPKCDS